MQRLILLLLVAVAFSGCSDDGPSSAESTSSSTGSASFSTSASTLPEPVMVREIVLEESVAVSNGLDAQGIIGCEGVSVGYTISVVVGLSLTQGRDYDFFETGSKFFGLDYIFTNEAPTEVTLAWMSGTEVSDIIRLGPNEVFEGTVPSDVDGGLFAACDTAGASGKIEVYDWVEL